MPSHLVADRMRAEIIFSVWYLSGIKCLSCKVMIVLKIGGSINFYVCAQRGNGAGLHRLHTRVLQTQTYLMWPGKSQWLISPQAALHFTTRAQRMQFSVCAHLLYYLRTTREKICFVNKCLCLDRKEHKGKICSLLKRFSIKKKKSS